jgi:NAD(P)H-dependent FMN reductase
MPLDLVVFFGSYRSDRLGARVARFVERQLTARGHAITVVDAKDVNLPMLDRMYKEYPKGGAPEALERLAGLYRKADAFVVITGEYNHGLQPGLKNLLDHFLEEYFWRPSAIVSYSEGSFGGVRAAVHLRESLAEMGMPAIPTAYPFPKARNTLDADGQLTDPKAGRRFDRFASELEWYAEALKAQRAKGTPY